MNILAQQKPQTKLSAGSWWETATIYQIYIRSFADANGDGIGDINGIISRLPYLKDLGVDGIWITPWYVSPMHDGGYDIANPRDIAPEFGTLADAKALFDAAHKIGIRVILDFVPNHVSTEHEWFSAAISAPENSPEQGRFWIRRGRGPAGENPPNNWRSVFGGSAWSPLPNRSDTVQLWYLHLFAPEQADLNWTSNDVHADCEKTMRFWFDLGADGLRVDVAHGMAKHPELPNLVIAGASEGSEGDADTLDADEERGDKVENHPFWDRDEGNTIFAEWRAVADSYADTPGGPRMFVAEAWRTRPRGTSRYVAPGRLHCAFNFDFLIGKWDAGTIRQTAKEHLDMLAEVSAPATWVLGSHDFIRLRTRLGAKDDWRRIRGSIDDIEVDLETGLQRQRALALFAFALPGCAYVYQGEELGLREVVDIPNDQRRDPIWFSTNGQARGRDGCRVPLPWMSTGPSFGFGTGEPWLWQPSDWGKNSVERQLEEDHSTLNFYRKVLAFRPIVQRLAKSLPMAWKNSSSGLAGFNYGDRFTCLLNVSGEPVSLPADLRVIVRSRPEIASHLPADTAVWLTPRESDEFEGNRIIESEEPL